MDIFSHAFWSGAAYKAISIKTKRPFKIGLAAFFGAFPDLFSFSVPFVWAVIKAISGDFSETGFSKPPPDNEPLSPDSQPVLKLAYGLYNISHSLIIFFAIFAIVWIWRKKPFYEMGGWLIHILIDIPTHSYKFFPTPFLWPVSDLKVNGFSWGSPWFLTINFIAIIIVFFWLKAKYKNNQKS